MSWSLASTVLLRVGLSKPPFGWFTLPLAMASRRSSVLSPRAASATGFARMRTACLMPPLRNTSPTPVICESFGARRVSAMSWTLISGRVLEVRAKVMIGASAGLTLL